MERVESAGSTRAAGIDAAARAWVLRLEEEPGAAAECAAWRAADPAHEQAWQEAQSVWQAAPQLATLERPDWRREIDDVSRQAPRRWIAWGMAAAAATFMLMIGLPQYLHRPDYEAHTQIGEVRTVVLKDGSRVTLGARSGIEATFEPGARRVRLNHGQAFFEVAPDPSRPFTVMAGDAEIRVTGTKFDVRRANDDVRIAVLEGRVEVRRERVLPLLRPEQPERVLTAGLETRLLAKQRAFSAEEHTEVQPGEWRTGRLYYRETPLAEIVADLQRYSLVPIRIEDDRVGALRVTTSLHAAEIEPFLANLTTILPISQRRTDGGAIVLASRQQ